MIAEIILLGLALYLLYKYYLMPVIPPNFPPGPINFPIIGGAYMIPKLDPVTGNAIIKLGEKYGPITGLYLGNELGLVVNGYETIKEVLSREEFNARPTAFDKLLAVIKECVKEKGILLNDGIIWQEQRRFTLRVLRDLGFGKSSLEGVIHDEIKDCLKVLSNKVSQSNNQVGVSIHDAFAVSIVNVLWHVVSGQRFKHDDKEFLEILEKIKDAFRTPNPLSNFIFAYPFLRHLPYFSSIFGKASNGSIAIQDLFRKTIADCKSKKSNEIDFIHEYLNEIKNLEEKGDKNSSFTVNQLISNCSDLFGAGAESTSNAIAFGMLYMTHYPEVQKKIHEELDEVVGKDELPSLSHKSDLVYTEAVLNELFRFTSVAPITVPHAAAVDTKLQGYDIPKGTMIQINLHSINMDKSYWGDPQNFRPERFIDSSGKLIKYDRLMPFGLGRRICPGESLARMNLYLFFTATLQAYKIEPLSQTSKPSLIPTPGFTIAPQPFNAILTPRK